MNSRRASSADSATVVVAVYNEAAHLEAMMDRLLAVTRGRPDFDSVVVVDDASGDGSAGLLSRWADAADVTLLTHARNRGKGAAIRTALGAVRSEWVVIQDADLEYDPADLPSLLVPIVEGQADVVYGSRRLSLDGRPRARSLRDVYAWGVGVLNVAVRMIYGLRLTDEATCYKAFRTEDLRRMDLRCERFEFCPEVTAKAARMGLRLIEVPIRYSPRTRREGKKIGWRDAVVALRTLWRYRRWVPAEGAVGRRNEDEHPGGP